MAVATTSAATAASDPADFDIAGIRLGMTPEEAEAALKAYDTELSLQKRMAAFRYVTAFSGIKSSEPFLQTLIGERRMGDGRIRIEVAFSPPPRGGRVIGVDRSHRATDKPTSLSDYRAAVLEKYGPPTNEQTEEINTRPYVSLEWHIGGGGVQCINSPEGLGMGSLQVLETLDKFSQPLRSGEAASAADCATFLYYRLGGDPVILARGYILDVAGGAEAELAAQEWVRQLQEEAAQPGTQKPKL